MTLTEWARICSFFIISTMLSCRTEFSSVFQVTLPSSSTLWLTCFVRCINTHLRTRVQNSTTTGCTIPNRLVKPCAYPEPHPDCGGMDPRDSTGKPGPEKRRLSEPAPCCPGTTAVRDGGPRRLRRGDQGGREEGSTAVGDGGPTAVGERAHGERGGGTTAVGEGCPWQLGRGTTVVREGGHGSQGVGATAVREWGPAVAAAHSSDPDLKGEKHGLGVSTFGLLVCTNTFWTSPTSGPKARLVPVCPRSPGPL